MADEHLNISILRQRNPQIAARYDRLVQDLIQRHLIGSTLVEGSTFTEAEAEAVLAGTTIHGHTVDEHQELINGKEASSFIHRLFFEGQPFSVKHLDQTHKILFDGVGDPKKKHPGKNRGSTLTEAFTVVVPERGKTPIRIEYENPIKLKADYLPFVEQHLNQALPAERELAVARLARLYFHFEMLHPYADGNGRIGRLLVSGKAAAEKGWLFRFEAKDGPEHLRSMVALTLDYLEKRELNFSKLESFLDKHLEDYD